MIHDHRQRFITRPPNRIRFCLSHAPAQCVSRAINASKSAPAAISSRNVFCMIRLHHAPLHKMRAKTLCMSHSSCYIAFMARGDSGRIVIEVGTETKRQLYAALDLAGSTLKEWFVQRAADFCAEATQPSLFNMSKLRPATARNQPKGWPRSGTVKSRASKRQSHRKRG